jgi:hypothetical protein
MLSFTEWAILEQEEFKVYKLLSRPNHIYRRAGKDSAGNPKWQYQEKIAIKKDEWLWVENKETIKALTAQYLQNLKKNQTPTSSNKVTKSNKLKDYWTLITIMACENYPDQSQGMADVAQSIYNRFNVSQQPYGKTISEIILSKNQYEPVTIGRSKGANWDSILSKEDAIQVYLKTKESDTAQAKSAIELAVSAQKDISLIKNAKKHVGSRTEFLSELPKSSKAIGVVEREPKTKHNSFFWNYAGKINYYDKKIFTATSKPSSVNIT